MKLKDEIFYFLAISIRIESSTVITTEKMNVANRAETI